MPKQIRYLDRNKEPTMEPKLRVKTHREYSHGFSPTLALDEAQRCLFCKDADQRCIKACPVGVDIPGFIKKITEGNVIGAYEVILKSDPFPSICGRVCPQERQCEGSCILFYDTVRDRKNKGLPVSIGALEKFVGDSVRLMGFIPKQDKKPPNGKSVAIVGAGPAGLSCANELALLGYGVDVYEALPFAGGVMVYGIPTARLDRSIIEWEVNRLKSLGVRFFFGKVVGRGLSIRELLESYDAVLLAVGAGRGKLGIPGEHLGGVFSAIEVLMRVGMLGAARGADTPIDLGKKTVIIGGGFTAVDCAITSLRLGVETHVVYRRTRDTSSARQEEWDHIQEEGAILHWLTQPVEIVGKDKVEGIKCIKMKLEGLDSSGRPKPIPVENSEHIIECDSVIFAIGQGANPIAYEDLPQLELSKYLTIKTDERFRTNIPKLYAAGDVVNGGDTVVRAIAEGKSCALSIHKDLFPEVSS
ncbi:MAG: NADPH-dependent glutamate synthase [Aquificaceae bacterium]